MGKKGKYLGKYRIESNRRKGWDYSTDATYFITLVTKNRKCILGKILDAKMMLSDIGKIVETEWEKSFLIRQELTLDEYIIMPNHIHAIIILKQPEKPPGATNDHAEIAGVQMHGRASLSRHFFHRMPKSISSFIAGFKSAMNSRINDYIDAHRLNIPKYNRRNHFFQPNYHDHIIRDEPSYLRIKKYITINPHN